MSLARLCCSFLGPMQTQIGGKLCHSIRFIREVLKIVMAMELVTLKVSFKIKFLHDVVFVRFYCAKADKEFVGNLFVGVVFAPKF